MRRVLINKNAIAAFLNRKLRRFDIALVRPSEIWRITDFLGTQPLPGPTKPARSPLIRTFSGDNGATTFDFAVVMPSILRPSIADALESIF
jgi:hypothetical protein